MRWARIDIETSRESENALSNLLVEMASGGVQIEEESPISDKVIVISYFPSDDMIGERISRITKLIENLRDLNMDVGTGRISLEILDEEDWSERWKEFFKPQLIGERILVSPSWESIEDYNAEPSQRDITIQIDPGMAFGTGRHSTTILSLELLEDALAGGEKVADVGTGSGILAIAAAKFGAKKVVAIDVDDRAAAIAKENSEQNGVSHRIHVICGRLLSPVKGKYDLIVSNISSEAILSMIPDFGFYLSADGKLILSGILQREASEVRDELESSNFTILKTRRDEEWAAVLAAISA